MQCSNCSKENETVKDTELGELCDDCYTILFAESFNIINEL